MKKQQRILLWTGGQNHVAQQCQPMADALPILPTPSPLYQTALIEYRWGEMKFEIVATACSLRPTSWGDTRVVWLHCKAVETVAINPLGSTSLINVLIPAHYVTSIKPGPAFRLLRSRNAEDLGVFPPIQPAPDAALALTQIEGVVTTLLAPERN